MDNQLPPMKFSRSSLVQIGLVLVFLVALVASLKLIRQPARPTPKAAGPSSVQVYLSPSAATIPPTTQFDLMVNPAQQPLSFVRVEINFNPSHLQLSQEITTTSLLKYVIQKTSASVANSTGHIIIVLGLAPEDSATAPVSPFSMAQLSFQSATIQLIQTQITFPQSGPQIQFVDLNLNDLPYTTSPATVNLNPTPTPTSTPTTTPTLSPTSAPTQTPTPSPTSTPTPTRTPTPTAIPTPTPTPSPTPVLTPGDANGDGRVDGLDYTIWLNHYNQSTDLGYSAGDFNLDGFVNGLDYTIWLINYQI